MNILKLVSQRDSHVYSHSLIFLCDYAYLWAFFCYKADLVVKGQLNGAGSFLVPCEFHGLNLGQ